MNSSSSANALTQPSQFRSWYEPTTFAQDQLDPTGYKGFYQDYLSSIRTNPTARPHAVTSFLEASRPRSVVELTEAAKKSLEDVLPFETWLIMAENARRDAETFDSQGNLEAAFLEFTRASTIVRDKLPFPDHRAPFRATSLGRDCYIGTDKQQAMLDRLAEIKVPLMERYEKWLENNPSVHSRSAPGSVPHLRPPKKLTGHAKRRSNQSRHRDAMLITPSIFIPATGSSSDSRSHVASNVAHSHSRTRKNGWLELDKQVVSPVSLVLSTRQSPDPPDVATVPSTKVAGASEALGVTAEVLNVDELSLLETDSFITDTSIASYKTEKSINSRKSRYNALPRRKYAGIEQPRIPLGHVSEDIEEDSVPKSKVDTNPDPSVTARGKDALAHRTLPGASESLRPPSLRPIDGLSAGQPPQFDSSLSSHSPRETLSPSSPNGVSSSSATEKRDKQKEALPTEVQRRVEAAGTQLKKTPSSAKITDVSHKKRIESSKISGPKLISSDEFCSLPQTTPIGPKANFVEKSGPNSGAPAQLFKHRFEIFESSDYGLSIVNTALRLERTINRWASEVLRIAPASAAALQEAVLTDISYVREGTALFTDVRPITVQYLLRHALANVISEGIVNSLIVTNSVEANLEFTRAHERLLTRDVGSAAVWRRHTLSIAVDGPTPEMMRTVFEQTMPLLAALLKVSAKDPLGTCGVFEDAFKFSCLLRGANPDADALYRSFVPKLASRLHSGVVELVKPCRCSERGKVDRVAVTVFPGLVEVLPTPPFAQMVVRRAQVICGCEFIAPNSGLLSAPPPPPGPPVPRPLTM